MTIDVPALRHGRDDIPELAAHFLEVGRRKHPGAAGERFSAEAMTCLQRHSWPGNVRELEHLVERSLLLGSDAMIGVGDLPRALQDAPARAVVPAGPTFAGAVLPLAELQRRYAAWALEQLGGRSGRPWRRANPARPRTRTRGPRVPATAASRCATGPDAVRAPATTRR